MNAPGSGVVAEFDEARGFGWIEGDDGARFFFHCTQIADGSRTIEEGARVSFEVRPGHLGRWDAAAVRPSERS